MKHLFIATVLAFSAVALANDPDSKMGSSRSDKSTSTSTYNTGSSDEMAFSEQHVIDKLHHVNQMNIQYGNLAQTRASSNDVRKFGAKLVKDSTRFDDNVISFAKANNITLGASVYGSDVSTGISTSTGTGTTGATGGTGASGKVGVTNEKQGYSGGTTGSSGSSASAMGSTTPSSETNYGSTGTVGSSGASGTVGSTSSAQNTPSSTGSTMGSSRSTTGNEAGSTSDIDRNVGSTATNDRALDRKMDKQAKLDALRNLQGTEFDSQFLSDVVDSQQHAIDRLTSWRGQGDKKLDALIDKGIKQFRANLDEAQKLQQKVPASS